MVWSFHFEWCHMTFDSTKLISCSYISEISLAQLEEGDSCFSPAMCNENVSLQKGMLPVIQGTMTNYIVIKCTVIAWRIMFLANWSTSLCCSFPYIEPLLLHCIIYFIILIWTCVTFQFSSIFRSRLFFTSPSSATLRKVYFRML